MAYKSLFCKRYRVGASIVLLIVPTLFVRV